jgi:hypothetical protein
MPSKIQSPVFRELGPGEHLLPSSMRRLPSESPDPIVIDRTTCFWRLAYAEADGTIAAPIYNPHQFASRLDAVFFARGIRAPSTRFFALIPSIVGHHPARVGPEDLLNLDGNNWREIINGDVRMLEQPAPVAHPNSIYARDAGEPEERLYGR